MLCMVQARGVDGKSAIAYLGYFAVRGLPMTG